MLHDLLFYAQRHALVDSRDLPFVTNQLLALLHLNAYTPQQAQERPLHDILQDLVDDAVTRGLCDDSPTARDLFDTALMGALTPPPSVVQDHFAQLYVQSPQQATDWYYQLQQSNNYIRLDRIAKDRKWTAPSSYGELDITINLSKPEKDPKAIALAKTIPQSGYPACLLCRENEGYAGHLGHPARQNLRLIPQVLDGQDFFVQYSPYVYYPQHCIVFHSQHVPMTIGRSTFQKLLDFVAAFPHYFLGSNADLPIVGGSILTHDHYQGGCYTFPMERAPIERPVTFSGFEQVRAGIVHWPMSVLRLRCETIAPLVDLAESVLTAWRDYSHPEAQILAYTDDTPHNTITPIARHRDGAFELDLVLRNNRTTQEHPLGLFHPHSELHHIKKENIGLIEVMGLAVLPGRLEQELQDLANALVHGQDLSHDESLAKHAPWCAQLLKHYTFTKENVDGILRQEVGSIFSQVLEHAGVYPVTEKGRHDFQTFLDTVIPR